MLEWFNQYRAFRFGVGIIVLFIVACVQSCSELKHSLWGVITSADVTDVAPSDRGARYQFVTLVLRDEDGRPQRVKRTVPISARRVTTGEKVEVIHLPGQVQRARLVEERSMAWPTILVVLLAAWAIWLLIAWREVKAGRG